MGRKLLSLAVVALAAASPALAAPGGALDTLPHGRYDCAKPGDATGAAWRTIPDRWFVINTASTYETESGDGTYLLTGKRVTFTRGPLKGQKFDRTGSTTLRWIDENGKPGDVRCVRSDASR